MVMSNLLLFASFIRDNIIFWGKHNVTILSIQSLKSLISVLIGKESKKKEKKTKKKGLCSQLQTIQNRVKKFHSFLLCMNFFLIS